jgi:hypothetical protein
MSEQISDLGNEIRPEWRPIPEIDTNVPKRPDWIVLPFDDRGLKTAFRTAKNANAVAGKPSANRVGPHLAACKTVVTFRTH